ncbi:MAG: FAD-dependent oxidoreductase [Bdellovibrio sp.]|nr:FAD-dependent oxidoreductase [Bdellovibrio sp.]
MDYQFDVLVLGSGVAGLATALTVLEKGLSVGLVTRARDPNNTNTSYAQGGIIYTSSDDGQLLEDIDKASAHTSNLEAAQILRRHSGRILEEILLKKAKTNFTRNEKGELLFTREAAHSCARIIYQGDFTGLEIQNSLMKYILEPSRFPKLTVLEGHTAIDLITPIHHGTDLRQRYEPHKVVGAYLFNRAKENVVKALARATVLATGGVGAVFLHHSNAEGARGDGHAMAKRAGAFLTDMEFIQFHPTTFFDRSGHRRFLISETVRGEGGILVNAKGERFMKRYHKDLELAPRDVVARAIAEEMIITRHDCVYLDISHKPSDWIVTRFPTIYRHCLENKVDMTKVAIPVVPSAHYTCGGVKTDLKGRTTLQNLYAVGEVACTGLHGANRLASTSLLEGLTFGHLAALDIADKMDEIPAYSPDSIRAWEEGKVDIETALIQQDWLTLKQTMWNYVGLIRTTDRLVRADAMLWELYVQTKNFYRDAKLKDSLIGLRNAIEVGLAIMQASRINRKSEGCFFRKN